jgi:hypothetical protein
MPKEFAMDKAKCPTRQNKSKTSLHLLSIHSTLPLVQMTIIKVEMKAKIAPNTFMVKTFCELVPIPLKVVMNPTYMFCC